jgi:anti-sigma regulatory factor (Ser/Thr protein kinase)
MSHDVDNAVRYATALAASPTNIRIIFHKRDNRYAIEVVWFERGFDRGYYRSRIGGYTYDIGSLREGYPYVFA